MNLSAQRISVQQNVVKAGYEKTDTTILNLSNVLNGVRDVNDAMCGVLVGDTSACFSSARTVVEAQIQKVCNIFYGATGEMRWYTQQMQSAKEQAIVSLEETKNE